MEDRKRTGGVLLEGPRLVEGLRLAVVVYDRAASRLLLHHLTSNTFSLGLQTRLEYGAYRVDR